MTNFAKQVLNADEYILFTEYNRKTSRNRRGGDEQLTQDERNVWNKYYTALKNKEPLKHIYTHAKHSAKVRNIDFEITYDEFLTLCKIYDCCPLTGVKLEYTHEREGLTKFERQSARASLDRINNDYCYSVKNCWIVSAKANIDKGQCTLDMMEATLAEAKKRGLR